MSRMPFTDDARPPGVAGAARHRPAAKDTRIRTGTTITSAERRLAGIIAFVTFALTEAAAGRDEAALPGRYVYHVFHGFPGFCDHAAAAGLALCRALTDADPDVVYDIADIYAAAVLDHAYGTGAAADNLTLRRLAEAALEPYRTAADL